MLEEHPPFQHMGWVVLVGCHKADFTTSVQWKFYGSTRCIDPLPNYLLLLISSPLFSVTCFCQLAWMPSLKEQFLAQKEPTPYLIPHPSSSHANALALLHFHGLGLPWIFLPCVNSVCIRALDWKRRGLWRWFLWQEDLSTDIAFGYSHALVVCTQ